MRADDLEDFAAPGPQVGNVNVAGPAITPKQRLFLYSSEEWEEFILEWAMVTKRDYVALRRFGGAGDKGVDVAGFTDAEGFRGVWDLFQAKHYGHSLTPTDAFPEILKLFVYAAEEEYRLPRRYTFVAPRECGTKLGRWLHDPPRLRLEFLRWLETATNSFSPSQTENARVLAEATDFAIFSDMSIEELLATHRASPYYVARFGGPLPERGDVESPPDDVQAAEMRYVDQLSIVYATEWPDAGITAENVATNAQSARPFSRQRVRFYSAEALRRYARDAVPEGTYEKLQMDVLNGVIDIAEAGHSTPLSRMNAVFETVGSLDLSRHVLMTVATQNDRRGICHQLANEDELLWSPE
jgi:hypothetical protein